LAKVEYWENGSGRSPVLDFICDQKREPEVQDRLLRQIDKLEGFGINVINRKELSSMGNGLFEIKIIFKNSYYRIFFGLKKGIIWLLHGIKKKSNKTPKRDLDLARKRLSDI